MRPAAALLIGCLLGAPLRAQEVPTSPTPAAILLQMRDALGLDTAQMRRLRELERIQSVALARSTAAFLRAEADVVEMTRSDDPSARRNALERRARLAIDAEVARMKWEKDARALLTAGQNADLPANLWGLRGTPPALWQALTTPLNLSAPIALHVDSGEVRISVTPNYADIYLNGEKRATGRKFVVLPVGKYELKLHAVGCEELVVPLVVTKGPPVIITRRLTCPE
jgi:hypothetical protein